MTRVIGTQKNTTFMGLSGVESLRSTMPPLKGTAGQRSMLPRTRSVSVCGLVSSRRARTRFHL